MTLPCSTALSHYIPTGLPSASSQLISCSRRYQSPSRKSEWIRFCCLSQTWIDVLSPRRQASHCPFHKLFLTFIPWLVLVLNCLNIIVLLYSHLFLFMFILYCDIKNRCSEFTQESSSGKTLSYTLSKN